MLTGIAKYYSGAVLAIAVVLGAPVLAELPPPAEYTEQFEKRVRSQADSSRILMVGPDGEYRVPSEAAKHARDNDVIYIDGRGKYHNDYVIWKQNNLTLVGANGQPKITSSGTIPNNKAIWILKGHNTTIENIEFSGARVSDRNGAALRVEGTGLTIKNSYIHHCENGILAGNDPESEITITNSEFAHNGHGDGRTHNVYIGAIKRLKFIGNFSHHAKVGHTLKSRAAHNEVLYNRFMDGRDGNSSYLLDLPDAGHAVVMGNIFQQGPETENWTLLAYGMEVSGSNGHDALWIAFNTFVNDRSSGVFVKTAHEVTGKVVNNLFVGKGKLIEGNVSVLNNFHDPEQRFFADPDIFDYHPVEDAPFIDQGVVAGTAQGRSLEPVYQPGHRGLVRRVVTGERLDIGALEYWVY